MTITTDLFSAPLRALRAPTSFLLRATAALFGLVVMLGVLLLGLAAGTLLLAWALLRGRRPVLRFGGMPPGGGWPRTRAAARRAPAADVVDVEAREVPPSGPR